MDWPQRLIDFSLRHRGLIVLASLVLMMAGIHSLQSLDIDAFPDTTPVQVQINTVAAALGPEEVERQLTSPLEQALSGLPGLEQLRSISKFGLSQIVLVFRDGTDLYRARQAVLERLSTVTLPQGVSTPQLGPLSTGLGEVFHYLVTGEGTQLGELRTLHDWVIRPALRSVAGVAEVNAWGGHVRQYEVLLEPQRLAQHRLTLRQVVQALREHNLNVGGGITSNAGQMWLVQGWGQVRGIEDIADVVVSTRDGVPIRIADLGRVQLGYEIRRGAVTADGRGEAVLGLGFMLIGENSHNVTWRLKERLEQVRQQLPAHVRVLPVYDRTELVEFVLDTVRKNLFEGGLLVISVLFLFLGNIRAACLVALVIPLSMMLAFMGMHRFGIAASLLSLGAIDFGMIVDSSVVMMENCVRHLARAPAGRPRLEVIREAAAEVRRPTLFGELIIMIVYLPILTLEGVEGKLFRPMALTVIFALCGSMICSMTLMPVLASWFLPARYQEREPWLMRWIHMIHTPVLRWTLKYRGAVLAGALAVVLVTFMGLVPQLGSEFVPRLSEGALAVGIVRLAGTDLQQSLDYNTQMERLILQQFPDEVAHVWSRVGTAEVATDPMGLELTDLFITLKPRRHWKRAKTQAELVSHLDRLLRDLPGQRLSYSQPIEMRMNEMVSGVRADVGIKVFGDDLDVLIKLADRVATLISRIPGAADVAVEQVTGQPLVQIEVQRQQLGRYGLSAQDALEWVESLAGIHVGDVVDDIWRIPLVVKLSPELSGSPDTLRALSIITSEGELLPLERVATITETECPATITREWGQRRITVTANVRGRDLGSFVRDAQNVLAHEMILPSPRYRWEFGGQFEHLVRAQYRLIWVVPLALGLVFCLLYITYHNLVDTLRVLTSIPFAWVGGIIALWWRGMPFSISAAVGFIAMSGLAVLDDMLLVSTIRQLRQRGMALDEAVMRAAQIRLRPVLMTSLVAALGFWPMATSQGMGAEVQRPLATVVIGGVIGATVMSLLVLRALYMVFAGSDRTRQEPS